MISERKYEAVCNEDIDMSRQAEIDQMALIAHGHGSGIRVRQARDIAEALYKAGYRLHGEAKR